MPEGLPLRHSDNKKYYRDAQYEPESVEACYYYFSKIDESGKQKFFSFSRTLNIYVFDTNTYHSYSHKELLQTTQYQLAFIQVKEYELDKSDGFFTIDSNDGQFTITLLNNESI